MINYQTEKLDNLLRDFYNATGVNMDFYTCEFSSLSGNSNKEKIEYCNNIHNTKSGNQNCFMSDIDLLTRCKSSKKAEMHICPAGLVDVAVPIIHNGNIMGYVIFGQMRTQNSFTDVISYIEELSLDTALMKRLYDSVPFFDSGKIESILNIATMLAKHIMLENVLSPDYDKVLDDAVKFIENNFSKPLTINDISKNTNSSKTVLYEHFKKAFNCTIGEFINEKRIEHSITLLMNSDMTIENISQEVGFSCSSYFCKIFKNKMGISPFKYRQKKQGK